MLPFLKRPQVAGVIVKVRKPDEVPQETEEYPELNSASEDIIKAIEMKDPKSLSKALINAHDIMHSYMDQENPSNYDDMNEQAGDNE